MSLFRLTVLSLAVALSLPSMALADSADWEEEGGDDTGGGGDDGGDESGDDSSDDGGDEGGDDDGDGGSDTDDGAKDGRCMAAAVNPTTALSVGLGVALLFGLRRKD
jgi:hypothetical protein